MMDLLKSKNITVPLAIVFLAVVFGTGKLLLQKYEVDKQIAQLESRANQVRGQNQELGDLVNYLNTDQYKEKAAREQLNLKKEGEVVVGLPQHEGEQVASASTSQQISNPEKWYNYFFRQETK